MIRDEPRTRTERQADFFIGLLVGFGVVLGVGFGLLHRNTIGGWFLALALLFVLGCGYTNYRLGARLWSRAD